MTPVLVLLLAAVVVGAAVAFVSLRVPVLDPASPRAVRPAARAVERGLERRTGWRVFARARFNPRVATGLLLTVALAIVVLLGVLVFQVRTDRGIVRLDRTIERWADGEATASSNDVISAITDLGGTVLLVVIGAAVALFEWFRTRSARVFVFLVLVIGGQALASHVIKGLVGRGRPELGLLAGLDPSFPSGHSAGAAATFAACALLLGRRRSHRVQAVLTGIGVALAIAVAASRVLLGVHWFSDVIGGLFLGWAWFAIASLAFGGRLLHFGAPVEAAERHAELKHTVPTPPR
jgi:membrane-associated phospholipid phosphatase